MPESLEDIRSLIPKIPELEDAVPDRRLTGGEASVKWLLATGDQKFVLRIDRPVAGVLGLDRQAECDILEIVGKAEIGPDLVWAIPEDGLQICTFVEGRSWTWEDTRKPSMLVSLARTLARLHCLPFAGQPFDPGGAAKRYAGEIATAQTDELASRVRQIVDELLTGPGQSALCHNDLVHTNLVGQEPVRLIDWEYAATGDPCFDLAAVIRHHELPPQLIEEFLEEYERSAGPVSSQRLRKNCELYDLLAALWYQSLIPKSQPGSPFQAEWRRVMLRLNESHPGALNSGF